MESVDYASMNNFLDLVLRPILIEINEENTYKLFEKKNLPSILLFVNNIKHWSYQKLEAFAEGKKDSGVFGSIDIETDYGKKFADYLGVTKDGVAVLLKTIEGRIMKYKLKNLDYTYLA